MGIDFDTKTQNCVSVAVNNYNVHSCTLGTEIKQVF